MARQDDRFPLIGSLMKRLKCVDDYTKVVRTTNTLGDDAVDMPE